MKDRSCKKNDRSIIANEAVINQHVEMLRSLNWKALLRTFLGKLHRPAGQSGLTLCPAHDRRPSTIPAFQLSHSLDPKMSK
jgi:hypothetical protein